MSYNKWTPEPWGLNKHPRIENFRYSDWQPEDAIKIAYVVPKPDYDHALKCVNALAGVDNPEQFVKLKWDYEKELFDIRYLLKAPHEMTTLETVTAMMNQREELAEQCDLLQKGLESCMKQREELEEQVKELTEKLDIAIGRLNFVLSIR